MTAAKRSKRCSHKRQTGRRRVAGGSPRASRGHDRLGDARQKARNIIASWALQTLVAQRASEVTHHG
jgi:hypothetical protein